MRQTFNASPKINEIRFSEIWLIFKVYFFLVLAVVESVIVGKIGHDIGSVEMEEAVQGGQLGALDSAMRLFFIYVVMLMYALCVKSSAKSRRLSKIEKYAKGYCNYSMMRKRRRGQSRTHTVNKVAIQNEIKVE